MQTVAAGVLPAKPMVVAGATASTESVAAATAASHPYDLLTRQCDVFDVCLR